MQTIANVKTIQVTNLEDALEAQYYGQLTINIMTIRPGEPTFSPFRSFRLHDRPRVTLARDCAQLAAHHAIQALRETP